ncbi:MAG: hypothetical protein GXY38_10920 [Planctomycetes bacterium]|nr:hypothetical protein [Planctomycetota bacterium]
MNKSKAVVVTLSLAVSLLIAYGMWLWVFCRFYVQPGYMAVITAKIGDPLPDGQILAKPGQKGIWLDPLSEGRHFLNPIFYSRQIVPAIHIPAGKVGVVTSKVGQELPSGEFIAQDNQKGVWRRVLGPGLYRLNPHGYKVDVLDAISIPIGYVGVLTSLSGKHAPEGAFAAADQKGIMGDVLQPGLYYLNPRAYKLDVLEVGLNQVTLAGREGSQMITKGQLATRNRVMDELQQNVLAEQAAKREDYFNQSYRERGQTRPQAQPKQPQAAQPHMQQSISVFELSQVVEFPSRDGFEVLLDMTLEFELQPANVAWTFMKYGDLPAVVDKIILPQILSVSRLKGSSYKAQDFIVGEARERFQNDLKEALVEALDGKRISVHNSLIRHVQLPGDILKPIQEGSVAKEQNLTNIERQNTARKQAELNTNEGLIEQRRQEVLQETEKIVAETAARKDADVAMIGAQTRLQAAELDKQRAAVTAETTRISGQVRADVIRMVDGEKAKGFELKAKALGDGKAMVWLKLAESINSNVSIRILHAGAGTLWTDLKNATMGDLGGASMLKDVVKPAKPPTARN